MVKDTFKVFVKDLLRKPSKVKYDFEGEIEEDKIIQDSGIQQKREPSKRLKNKL